MLFLGKIILKGQPLSTQHIYKMSCRGGFARMYMSADGKALKEDYSLQAKKQWKTKIITEEIMVTVNLYHGTKRKADIDNFGKLIWDSLTGIVFEDDSQICGMVVNRLYDKENPRAEIEIYKSL